MIQKNIILIMRVYVTYESNICFGIGWKEFFLDLSNGCGNTEILISDLLNDKVENIINNKQIFSEIMDLSLSRSMSYIRY